MSECSHPNPVTSDLSNQGVSAKVTVCGACGATLDYRRLRDIDMGASGPSELPAEEVQIQAAAAAAKAREVMEESGEDMDALPEVELKHPSEEAVAENLKSKKYKLVSGVRDQPCEKHGGDVPPCDTGSWKAHHCTNSKWGGTGSFDGPCQCRACHA